MVRNRMPRDAGGAIEITEGTGPIRAMVSTGEFLEIYKVDKTFRVASPESIDPGRTNPNAPFTVSIVQNVGTSNLIVARVLLQGDQMLNFSGVTQDEATAIRKQLHRCKECLLRSETASNEVCSKIKAITEKVTLTGIPFEKGRVLNPFPHVENLEADCSTFLVEVNRAIKAISGLPSLFIPLERADNNFDHLGERLTKKIGEDEAVTKFVKSCAAGISRLVDMRNYLEHPSEKRTVINNFRLLPDGKLSPPAWRLSGEAPVQMTDDMPAIIDYLICISEEILIHLIMYRGKKRLAFAVQEIPDDQMDRDFPVKYKLLAYLKPFQEPGQATP